MFCQFRVINISFFVTTREIFIKKHIISILTIRETYKKYHFIDIVSLILRLYFHFIQFDKIVRNKLNDVYMIENT